MVMSLIFCIFGEMEKEIEVLILIRWEEKKRMLTVQKVKCWEMKKDNE